MKYVLKTKDIPLIHFDLYGNIYEGFNMKINKVENNELLPLGLNLTNDKFIKWLRQRNIPKNREFVNEILQSLNLQKDELIGLIEVGKSLSLNDTFWVTREGFEGEFKDYNLYENDFNKSVALVAYTGHGFSDSIGTLPELTTGGTLRKAWRNIDEGICLYKGERKGFSNVGKEPFYEFFASQIADAMGIKHVDYDLKKWEGELASTCKLFTDINIGYLPIYNLVDKNKGLKDIVDTYKNISEDAYQQFCSMMVFDAVIYNLDRHLGNFGVLFDTNTNEIKDIAPVFDNGVSLLGEANLSRLNSFDSAKEYCKTLVPAIGKSFDDNIALFKGPIQQKQIMKLINFKFSQHEKYKFPEDRLELIENILQDRIKEALNMKHKEYVFIDKNKEFEYDELPESIKEKALKEIEQILREAKEPYSAEEVIDNYLFKYFNEDISIIEKEPLNDYLYYKENREIER